MESIEKNSLVETSSTSGAAASSTASTDSISSTSPEDSEEYKVLAEELAILATELESKCLEVQAYKDNFERLQSDCSERTSEVERINSQLQKAKVDGNAAVEKLKKTEEDLANIKEKNAQLSDELLNKSRQVNLTELWNFERANFVSFRLQPLATVQAMCEFRNCKRNAMSCKRR